MGETTSDILIEDPIPFWRFDNSSDGILNSVEEFQSKQRITLGVVKSCLPKFLQGFRVEIPFHRRMSSRTL